MWGDGYWPDCWRFMVGGWWVQGLEWVFNPRIRFLKFLVVSKKIVKNNCCIKNQFVYYDCVDRNQHNKGDER